MRTTNDNHGVGRSRWAMPAFCLLLAGLIFGAFAIGGDAGTGLTCAALMIGLGALFALTPGSDTLQGLAGPRRDERWAAIDTRANSFTALVLIIAVLGGWLWEVAHGDDGQPFVWLAALSGLAYIAAVAFLRARG